MAPPIIITRQLRCLIKSGLITSLCGIPLYYTVAYRTKSTPNLRFF
ncbi:hypothetical protein COPCOM_02873 [Coprococcus comes ATCC 27758]|uniref:Uncharacterized protein n=1 Tax=Coprococcus comes ATCC 27758 TaxID=470146 RepID=C0BCI2_9FIRM|nr:hypothetical protein COPCOM_02873 [Coprococcus comes ATCC 27758]